MIGSSSVAHGWEGYAYAAVALTHLDIETLTTCGKQGR